MGGMKAPLCSPATTTPVWGKELKDAGAIKIFTCVTYSVTEAHI